MTLPSTTLRFIIIGGGIAGLTCAYFLKKGGYNVVVLEKYSRSEQLASQVGALRIPPNMSRLLQELPGTDKLFSERTTKCAGVLFYQSNGDDPAELIGKMDFVEDIMNDLGGDFYFISHKDFHEYLYSLCTNSGVEIRHEFEVMDVISRQNDPNSGGPTVVGHFGERITADIVIGADGKKSIAYKVLLAEEEDAEEEEDDSDDDSLDEKSVLPPMKVTIGATMTIPISLVQSDPELTSLLMADDYWSVFMGNKIHAALYKGLDEYVLALTYSGLPPQADDQDEEWISKGTPVKKVLERAQGFGPRMKKLIQLASTTHWFIQTLQNLPQHVSKLDEVVLIGDAVHTIYINGTHNTAAAFEEAFTLARLFTRSSCRSKEDAHILLNGYRQIQHKRTRALEINCMDAVVILGFLPGPEREGRNSGFRLTLNLDGADDATLEHVWSGYIAQFNYDARDAVDEWWMNWSRLAKRNS